ncbi:hypothetical protein [Pseudalkalibacillus decolorationis]|uniref:hypothetical protein n=1 Tax=Pseudalkalibacillus decolorationis TaxID=163879 RepID=UPI0021498350|nr:hypothetical protein [Pseudalkalibacillus decolorationis]
MIYGIIVLAIVGLLLFYFMFRMYVATNRYSFRNVKVYKKQSAGRILGVIGSACLLIGILLFVFNY